MMIEPITYSAHNLARDLSPAGATGQAPTRAPILTLECYPAEDVGRFEHASVPVNRKP